jgi:hypothetical protein
VKADLEMTPMNTATHPDVRRVLVMFKTHLDVGYTDTETAVVDRYFNEHIPRAVSTAAELRERDRPERLVWTVPAWLLYKYLEQTKGPDLVRAEAAIAAGDLAWHALPFTWYTELLDASVIRASLGFSARLDHRFGRRTTAARLTDVPGHTRGLIAPLVDAGVTFLDVGCNPGCNAPRVPHVRGDGLDPSSFDLPDPDNLAWSQAEPVHQDQEVSNAEVAHLSIEGGNSERANLFRWRDPAGKDLTVLYHPHAYGSTVRIPGSDLAVSMRVHGDNLGPQSVESVEAAYRSLAAKFPEAEIVPSTLTEIGDAITATGLENLPVLTSEIGDTWIYGTGSDPQRTAAMRTLFRTRNDWIGAGRLVEGGDIDLEFLEELIVAPEHNWGLSTSRFLRRWDTYRIDELAAARDEDPRFDVLDQEWQWKQQRAERAIQRLPEPLQSEAASALHDLASTSLPDAGAEVAGDAVLDNGTLRVVVDQRTGGISSLTDLRTGREWSNPEGLAQFAYQVYSAADYTVFNHAYNSAAFAYNDFAKPGLAAYPADSHRFSSTEVGLREIVEGDRRSVVADLHDPGVGAAQPGLASWPARVVVRYSLQADEARLGMELWVNGKPANRRPEALWLSFGVAAPDDAGWRYEKVGQQVDPRDVVPGGGRHLHGVEREVSYRDDSGWLRLDTLDAHLIAPGAAELLRYDDEPLALDAGFHVNLYNNLWGTAFPQWYDQDMRFRFTLAVGAGADADGREER